MKLKRLQIQSRNSPNIFEQSLMQDLKKVRLYPGVGRGRNIRYFPVFCPKVVLAIGILPDTLLDRSIHIVMQRKRPGQLVDQFRMRAAKDQAEGPFNATETWCKAHREAVASAYRKQHIDFLQDREADIWDPLFAIASVAIPRRVEELKLTALRLSNEKRK